MLSKIPQNLFDKEIHFYLPSIIPVNDPPNALPSKKTNLPGLFADDIF